MSRRLNNFFCGLTIILVPVVGCSKDPDPLSVYQRGLSAAAAGDRAALSESVEAIPNRSDMDPMRSILRGHLYRLDNNHSKALLEFSRANRDERTREESYFQGGRLLYESNQYSEALLLLRQVIAWNPDNIEAHRLVAAACYDIGAMEQAIGSLEEVSRRQPDDFRPHYMKATILHDFERFGDAELAFRDASTRALQNSVAKQEVHAGWGDCLIRLRKYEEALNALVDAGDWPDVLASRAQACFSLRRFDEAQAYASAALEKRPDHAQASVVMAQLEERSGKLEEAIARLKIVVSKHSMDLPPILRLADLLAAAGRSEESLQFRNKAGEIAELRSQFSKAHQDAVKDLSNASLRLRLADISEKLGQSELAAKWYLAAIGMAPQDEEIQRQWQSFLERNPEFTPSATAPSNRASSPPSSDF